MKIHKLHSHPKMENRLGVLDGHVIIDEEEFCRLIEYEDRLLATGWAVVDIRSNKTESVYLDKCPDSRFLMPWERVVKVNIVEV